MGLGQVRNTAITLGTRAGRLLVVDIGESSDTVRPHWRRGK